MQNKEKIIEFLKAQGATEIDMFEYKGLRCLKAKERGLWHISMSLPDRLPTYEEMKEVRYKFLPDNCYMAQIFPPSSEFVNVHPFTLHLYEIRP